MIDYYTADVITANDYAPFGALLPGRNYNAPSAKDYRYGFNGKENDNEVKGEGNQQDYGMRIYDPRLGRFLSVDPLTKNYPGLTPYQFASNRPIDGIDLDGGEWRPKILAPSIDFFFDMMRSGAESGQANVQNGGSFFAGYMKGAVWHGTTHLLLPMAAGAGGGVLVVESIPFLTALAANGATWAMNPANQALAVAAGKIFIGIIDPSPGGEISSSMGPEGSEGFVLKSTIKSIWRNSGGAGTRGKAFEFLASLTKYKDWEWVGKLDRGYFPTIDFVNDMVGVQLKTFFGKAKSFSVSEYKGYIDKLVGAVGKGYVTGKDRSFFVKGAELDILVPEGYIKNKGEKAFEKIWGKFNEVIEYGKSKGVDVNIDHKLDKPQ